MQREDQRSFKEKKRKKGEKETASKEKKRMRHQADP